jgi:hypothetical protein
MAVMALRTFCRVSGQSTRVLAIGVLSTAFLACAADQMDRRLQPTAPAAGSGAFPPFDQEAICPPTNPFCTDSPDLVPIGTPESPTVTTCANTPIDLSPAGINIMIAVDGSSSMETHWSRIQEAIRGLRSSHPDSAFGIQIFWAEVAETFDEVRMQANICGVTQNRVLDIGPHSEAQLISHLGTAPPGPAFLGGLFETSPVVEPLNYYLTNASKLVDPTRTNYLLFVTDGNDNCFGSAFTSKEAKLIAYEKLAIELLKLNIRTIPVGFDSATRPGASGRFGTTPANTDLDVLSTLLKFGGSGLAEVPKVDDPAKLGEVIAQVGQSVRNCRFEIPAALDPNAGLNPFELSFTINGKKLPRDRLGKEGWNFVDGNTAQVELFGQACQAVRAAQPLEARKTCETDVCGTSAIKVETKPRAVLFLLDASASRIECIDGTLDCLVPPNSGWERTLAFWEVVQNVVGQSLTVPINDDVEFGLQFFPGKDASALSCDVATAPEIVPQQGTEITIMRQMYQKLPFGFSPVVQILENVAANPGRLADPSVLGSVVLLSDGGDNCSGEDQDGIVRRLGAAAKTLHDKGIKTFAVRFGSEDGRTPENEAQLRAVVSNGGTDESDPNDPSKRPYIDAKDQAQLNAALGSISDRLATCSFTLGNLPTDADKSKANLYLNGEVIPFDATGSKKDGWNWIDAEKTAAELYGDACTAFKTNRRTSVVVEIGCMQIPVVLL